MKISKGTQEKLANLLKSQGYLIRYEKGAFRSGYCIVKDKKTVLINKFFPH
jgi:mRNA-degrading endonuclease RelE of RelBE toxin-antitoxin system